MLVVYNVTQNRKKMHISPITHTHKKRSF